MWYNIPLLMNKCVYKGKLQPCPLCHYKFKLVKLIVSTYNKEQTNSLETQHLKEYLICVLGQKKDLPSKIL